MTTLFVSTCGTSLFTNGAGDLGRDLRESANDDATTLRARSRGAELVMRLERQADVLSRATPAEAKLLSAELNGLVSSGVAFESGAHHVLLVTATAQGEAAGQAAAAWIRARGPQVTAEVRVLDGLSTASVEAFEGGMASFADFCRDYVGPYREAGHRVVFNLVGGFKALLAYATLFGMIYADEQLYLFDGPGMPLLRIPRVPLKFDLEASVRRHVGALRGLSLGLGVSAEELSEIPDALLFRQGGEVTLSTWGQLAWDASKRAIYAERLLDSPSAKVVYEDTFARSVKGIETDRLVQVNERVDDLARYVSVDLPRGTPPLARLDLKSVKGSGRNGSTHECDAWSDKDARRIYLRLRDGVAHLDRVDRALH